MSIVVISVATRTCWEVADPRPDLVAPCADMPPGSWRRGLFGFTEVVVAGVGSSST